MGKGDVYKLLYRRWAKRRGMRTPGYTVLLPVPGDLPVFLRIALEVCAAQRAEDRVETLVIPDDPSPAFKQAFASARSTWTGGPIRLVELGPLSKLFSRKLKNPHNRHWLQLVHGINQTRSTHALLHDADLFISEPTFLDQHYRTCAQRRLACLGVSQVWDSWYRENGLAHVTATWELLFDVQWARTFKPWQHRGHDGIVNGMPHTFDTMLLPQCLTPPDRIDRHEREWGFIHFNYVICTYRAFQRSTGPFEDADFRLLLVRMLIEAWKDTEWPYEVPLFSELARGLADGSARVTYRDSKTAANFPIFRRKLQNLIDCGILDAAKVQTLREGVRPFDEAFAWSGMPAATTA